MRKLIAALALAATLLPVIAGAAEPAPAATPLSLEQAVAVALKQNLSYRAARVGVDAANAQLRQAESPRLPGVALRDTYQYVNPVAKLDTPFGELPFSTTNATNVPLIGLQYTLFDGGLTAARVGQAAAGLAASRASEREARGAVVTAVSTAYYDLIAAGRLASVANRAVDVADQHLKQAQQLYTNGMIPKADVLRAETELANERVNAIGAANAVELAQTNLDNTLNVPLTNVYEPTDDLTGAPPPSFNLDALLAGARTDRGELAAARASVTAAEAAVNEAKSGYLPQIGLTVANGNTQPAVVSGYHNQFSIGLSAVWTLFDHGYTSGRVAAARAGVEQAKIGLNQLEDGVELQVRQAYLNVNEATSRVTAAQRLADLAAENLRLAQVRYRGGVSTALELQDAELRNTSAQQTLVGAEVGLRESIVQLRFAAGLL